MFATAQQAQQQASYGPQGNQDEAYRGLGHQQGRVVDKKLQDEMLIRRTGNICLAARDEGWKMRGRYKEPAVPVYQFAFVKAGKLVVGESHRDRRQALINATEKVAQLL